jgi:hypothetical protein
VWQRILRNIRVRWEFGKRGLVLVVYNYLNSINRDKLVTAYNIIVNLQSGIVEDCSLAQHYLLSNINNIPNIIEMCLSGN